jgi:Fic family protein
VIAPFANGNGRFGRIITEQVCKYYRNDVPTWGLKLTADPAKRRAAYISALSRARQERDYSQLISFMFD